MTSIGLLQRPSNSQIFDNYEDLLLALYDWAIIDKFDFRVAVKRLEYAQYFCLNTNCNWSCSASALGPEEEEWTLAIASEIHTCVSTGSALHAAASHGLWLKYLWYYQ